MTMPNEMFDPLLKKSRELDESDQSNEAWFARIHTRLHREWLFLDAERAMMRQKWADYFKEFDVLLCPAARIAAFPHDHTEFAQRVTRFNDQDMDHGEVLLPWAALTIVTYLPATVAPVGYTSNDLPVGVQIVGPYMEDRTPIHIARIMEEIFGGFTPPSGFE